MVIAIHGYHNLRLVTRALSASRVSDGEGLMEGEVGRLSPCRSPKLSLTGRNEIAEASCFYSPRVLHPAGRVFPLLCFWQTHEPFKREYYDFGRRSNILNRKLKRLNSRFGRAGGRRCGRIDTSRALAKAVTRAARADGRSGGPLLALSVRRLRAESGRSITSPVARYAHVIAAR
ncbi:hypothetical protein EVAR_48633_1 [Eumeta japonica]|uniref:Uncharacterized protein n=1 Tax=Eumeta variegata TaxID=151549 RepID=A0A4C1XMK0_EUMVA|nr:hypothetical protein EVAR_48633_1 [Eumeta japonica]